ncbi:TPA: hypothetical protein ACKRE5_001517 [Proteus mirabilis]
MGKSRQQFEEFFIEQVPNHSNNVMHNALKESFWVFWQASRESLEIELPEEQEILDSYEIGFNNAVNRVKDILISNGVKIKNE